MAIWVMRLDRFASAYFAIAPALWQALLIPLFGVETSDFSQLQVLELEISGPVQYLRV